MADPNDTLGLPLAIRHVFFVFQLIVGVRCTSGAPLNVDEGPVAVMDRFSRMKLREGLFVDAMIRQTLNGW
jgi:hypothetical protein